MIGRIVRTATNRKNFKNIVNVRIIKVKQIVPLKNTQVDENIEKINTNLEIIAKNTKLGFCDLVGINVVTFSVILGVVNIFSV